MYTPSVALPQKDRKDNNDKASTHFIWKRKSLIMLYAKFLTYRRSVWCQKSEIIITSILLKINFSLAGNFDHNEIYFPSFKPCNNKDLNFVYDTLFETFKVG